MSSISDPVAATRAGSCSDCPSVAARPARLCALPREYSREYSLVNRQGGNMRGFSRLARGATQLGFVDVLTAVILLGILLYAATVQFSVYNRPPAPPIPTGNSASR